MKSQNKTTNLDTWFNFWYPWKIKFWAKNRRWNLLKNPGADWFARDAPAFLSVVPNLLPQLAQMLFDIGIWKNLKVKLHLLSYASRFYHLIGFSIRNKCAYSIINDIVHQVRPAKRFKRVLWNSDALLNQVRYIRVTSVVNFWGLGSSGSWALFTKF